MAAVTDDIGDDELNARTRHRSRRVCRDTTADVVAPVRNDQPPQSGRAGPSLEYLHSSLGMLSSNESQRAKMVPILKGSTYAQDRGAAFLHAGTESRVMVEATS
jgi:hypothetical protein